MDQVAALAAVSKQTVYKHFVDKYQLFAEIMLDVAGTVDSFVVALAALQETDDLERDLRRLARRYVASVTQPHVTQLRRRFSLVVASCGLLPRAPRPGPRNHRSGNAILPTIASRPAVTSESSLVVASTRSFFSCRKLRLAPQGSAPWTPQAT